METLHSLLEQRRPPLEIVISDHQSTDDTPEIIADFVAKYPGMIRGVKPPAGCNLTAQYNFTLASQRGDWITLLSSDDVARPNFCEVLLRGAERRPDAAVVRAGWENIDAEDRIVSTEYMLSVGAVEEFPKTLLSQKNGPKVSFAAFALRREAWLQTGEILASMESLSDWALFAQMAPYGPFVYEPEIISGYRVGHDGDKFRTRAAVWIRDEQRMFYEVLPKAAQQGGMTDLSWIDEASRSNFMRYLASASEKFQKHERSEVVPLLEPWANKTGHESELRAFAAGKKVTVAHSLQEQIKARIRPIVQTLYRSWRGQ